MKSQTYFSPAKGGKSRSDYVTLALSLHCYSGDETVSPLDTIMLPQDFF